jgi:hypothetical protein
VTTVLDWLGLQLDRVGRLIERVGLLTVLWSPFVVTSVIAGIVGWRLSLVGGVILGLSLLAVELAILVAALVVAVKRHRDSKRLLTWDLATLRSHVYDHFRANARILLQRDQIVVKPNGDATWHSRLTYRVEDPRPLHFVRVSQAGEPLTQREQERMEFVVQEHPSGMRLGVQPEWTSDRDVTLWIHFHKEIQPGDQVTIETDFHWPRQLPDLGNRGVELVSWTAEFYPTDELQYDICLAGHGRNQDLGIGGVNEIPRQFGDATGWRVQGRIRPLPLRQTVSLRLDAR